MPARSTSRVVALVAALAGPACVTEIIPGTLAGARGVLHLPEPIDFEMWNAGSFHGVQLIFEMNFAQDIAGLDDPDKVFHPILLPEIHGPVEVYRTPGSVHELTWRLGEFTVGGYHYPSDSGARLYVLKPRTGDVTFSFRGQKIVVKSDRGWKPSIYWHTHTEHDPDGRVAWVEETLRVGLATIETDSRSHDWRVDGRPHTPSETAPLILYGAVDLDA